MNKGLFSIPVYSKEFSMNKMLNEVIDQVVKADAWGLSEAYFGEHITDKHEKITSSLMMIATLAKLTKSIKLGSLTTNLNFYNPAILAALVSMADNLSEGRLILGIGSGANMTDIEAINSIDKNNHALTLEIEKILKTLLKSENFVNIKSENFNVSTKKYGNENLGLGYFNQLYKKRNDLEIVMPALSANSYNVKLCAKNNWSIVISNFCSEKIIDNHISNYLENSNLDEKDAFKRIKLSKLIFVNKDKNKAHELAFSKESPYMRVIETIFNKLKTFDKHSCFGENINNTEDAAKSILFYGDSEEISKKINNKYKNLSSIIYVTVPMTGNKDFDDSLENFARHVTL
jgi:hypothetical protein